MARLGGLSSATPKPVYESLQNEFPEVTLQVGLGAVACVAEEGMGHPARAFIAC